MIPANQAARDEAVASLLDAGETIKAHGGDPLVLLTSALEHFDKGAFLVAGLAATYEVQRLVRQSGGGATS